MTGADKNLQIYQDYEGEWAAFRRRADKYNDFYYSKQYTAEEEQGLIDMGLKPIVINIIRPIILQHLAILTSSRPTWRVVPTKGATKEVADISGRFLIGKWNSDYLDIQQALVAFDMLVTGLGWLFVDIASFMDNATLDIVVKRMNTKFVYADPLATQFNFSDAENILIKKDISPTKAQILYKLSDKQLRESLNTVDVNSVKTVELIDRFSKVPCEVYEYDVKYTDEYTPDLRDLPPRHLIMDRRYGHLKRAETDLIRNLKVLMSEGKIDLRKMNDLSVYRTTSIGKYLVHEGMMKIKDYPLIPFANEFTDEAKKIQGEANSLIGIQEGHNKYYMLVLHNAMLTGNVRVLAPKNAIKDVTAFQKTWALPGVVWEWEVDSTLPDGGAPKIVPPGQLSSAFYQLSADLMAKAEYESAVFGPLQGNPQSSPETFSTTSTLQNFGSQRIKFNARKMDIQLAKAGEVVLQYIQRYSREDELLEFIDDRPFTEDGQVNAEFGEQKQIGTLNQHIVNAGVVKEIKNDARVGTLAVKVLTQPNLGTDRLIKGSMLQQMVMNKALPPTPAVMKKMFDLIELPGYAEMIAEMQSTQVSEQQLQQMAQQMQMLQKQNQMLRDESMKMAKKLEINDFEVKLEKELLNIKKEALANNQELSKGLNELTREGNQNGAE